MPEGILCNKNKVTTLEQLQALLAEATAALQASKLGHTGGLLKNVSRSAARRQVVRIAESLTSR